MLDSSSCMLDCSDETQPCKAFCVLVSIVAGGHVKMMVNAILSRK